MQGANSEVTKALGPKICAINFWPDFTLATGFIGYLLRQAFGSFEITTSQAQADLVLTSVFMQSRTEHPEKTIALIWENLRPNFDLAHYALSFDFDSYDGRNCRLPYWYSQLAWPGYAHPGDKINDSNHGFEPLLDIDDLLTERNCAKPEARDRFCAFVAGNPEGHRMLAAKSLSKISPVDIYGNVAKRPLRGSKLDLFKQYRFALCFENSIFPGYYTEKPVHAWAGGCVPLYFSDRFADRDFNPAAIVNRIEFATLDEFRQHVARLDASQDAQAEIVSRPLLRERPSLDPAIGFLRETAAKITRAARPNVLLAGARPAVGRAGPPPKVARNAPCSCGSGKKYKHCHGAST